MGEKTFSRNRPVHCTVPCSWIHGVWLRDKEMVDQCHCICPCCLGRTLLYLCHAVVLSGIQGFVDSYLELPSWPAPPQNIDWYSYHVSAASLFLYYLLGRWNSTFSLNRKIDNLPYISTVLQPITEHGDDIVPMNFTMATHSHTYYFTLGRGKL